MFQMSKQLFDQCWPVIAAQIEAEKSSAEITKHSTHSPGSAAEARYVLGIAIGYALQVGHVTGAPVSTSVPGWRADACGDMNWPRVAPSQTPPLLGSRPA